MKPRTRCIALKELDPGFFQRPLTAATCSRVVLGSPSNAHDGPLRQITGGQPSRSRAARICAPEINAPSGGQWHNCCVSFSAPCGNLVG